MQKAFLQSLYDLASTDSNVLMLSADNGLEFDKLFKSHFKKQYLEFGIAECNMVAAAAGLALNGKVPFVHTASNFLAFRAYEFIRNDVCIHNANVKLIGFGSGLSNSTLGPSHHSTEDIGVLNCLPNLTILSASSPRETTLAIQEAYSITGPVYIRIGLVGEQEYQESTDHNIYKSLNIIREGKDAIVFSTGSIITEVLLAAKHLQEDGVNLKVVNINKIKPFPKNNFINTTINFQNVITVEEHNVNGGIGSIIADELININHHAKLTKIGLDNGFARGYGTQKDMWTQNDLDSLSISKKIHAALKN